jgi:beta-aspartyl-peptidase (threonine type)
LNAGAVAAVRDIRHPIDLARKVMEDGRHVLLVGEGASAFARAAGVELADPQVFEIERRRHELHELQQFDTVGAVARDEDGHFAVAVSTGGYTGKLPGRVGDSPIPGAGFYADDTGGAACATGKGEGFLRTVLCKEIVDHLIEGWSAQAAANDAIERLSQRVAGVGGVVVIDSHGRAGAGFNTPHLPWAERHL